jgi:P-type Ca2+ transporter type 2C
MRRPPRKLTDRVIDRQMQRGVLFVGLAMALATLLAIDLKLPGGLVEGSAGLTEARTAGFTVLVLAQLFKLLQLPLAPDQCLPRPVLQPPAVGGGAEEAAAAIDVAAAPSRPGELAGHSRHRPWCPGATSSSPVGRWPSATAR